MLDLKELLGDAGRIQARWLYRRRGEWSCDVVSTLFEPYRRGPEAEAGQGSLGLGLFITRQIVLAHGGDIHVRSTPEEGTTFSVRLPLQLESTRQPGGACSGGHP